MENQDIVGLFHVKHKRNICDLPGIYLNRIKRRMARRYRQAIPRDEKRRIC